MKNNLLEAFGYWIDRVMPKYGNISFRYKGTGCPHGEVKKLARNGEVCGHPSNTSSVIAHIATCTSCMSNFLYFSKIVTNKKVLVVKNYNKEVTRRSLDDFIDKLIGEKFHEQIQMTEEEYRHRFNILIKQCDWAIPNRQVPAIFIEEYFSFGENKKLHFKPCGSGCLIEMKFTRKNIGRFDEYDGYYFRNDFTDEIRFSPSNMLLKKMDKFSMLPLEKIIDRVTAVEKPFIIPMKEIHKDLFLLKPVGANFAFLLSNNLSHEDFRYLAFRLGKPKDNLVSRKYFFACTRNLAGTSKIRNALDKLNNSPKPKDINSLIAACAGSNQNDCWKKEDKIREKIHRYFKANLKTHEIDMVFGFTGSINGGSNLIPECDYSRRDMILKNIDKLGFIDWRQSQLYPFYPIPDDDSLR